MRLEHTQQVREHMRTKTLLSLGLTGTAILVVACSKSGPGETTPEQAAGAQADTTTAAAGAAQDSTAAATGAYGDSTAAAGVRDSVIPVVPDTTTATPDTTGVGAGADSVRSDSM
jgi:hypothetical protein